MAALRGGQGFSSRTARPCHACLLGACLLPLVCVVSAPGCPEVRVRGTASLAVHDQTCEGKRCRTAQPAATQWGVGQVGVPSSSVHAPLPPALMTRPATAVRARLSAGMPFPGPDGECGTAVGLMAPRGPGSQTGPAWPGDPLPGCPAAFPRACALPPDGSALEAPHQEVGFLVAVLVCCALGTLWGAPWAALWSPLLQAPVPQPLPSTC